jgi:fructuronate reductase
VELVMRLSQATVARLPANVSRPRYDRQSVRIGVVHLGIGAFHRAHQAVFFERALAAGDMRWGITGVSLRSPDVRDRLAPQDGLYTVRVCDGNVDTIECIGAIREVLVAPEAPQLVVARLADPATHIVTLTVTEKGYHLDPVTGGLNFGDPAIVADLASPDRPATAAGLLVAGLAARRDAGLGPFTTISCDNLPGNGERLKASVIAMASNRDLALANWIKTEAAFPNTMVDRMVPATNASEYSRVAEALGLDDRGTLRTEPFLQWIVEDTFSGETPDFTSIGVQLCSDVTQWEEAKLRLLNGAHSAIAYLGGSAGFAFVHDAVANSPIRNFVETLWDEVIPTLSLPEKFDAVGYRNQLLKRFENATLRHATAQIAQDGSQKIPRRLFAPLAQRLSAGQSITALSMTVAGWMRWLDGCDDHGAYHIIMDPLAAEFAERRAGRPEQMVDFMLSTPGLFPLALATDERLRSNLIAAYDSLVTNGVIGALDRLQSYDANSEIQY